MTVALSILFAALVGGVVYAVIDASFERRDRRPAAAAPTEPLPTEPLPPAPLPARQPEPERRRDGLWAGRPRD